MQTDLKAFSSMVREFLRDPGVTKLSDRWDVSPQLLYYWAGMKPGHKLESLPTVAKVRQAAAAEDVSIGTFLAGVPRPDGSHKTARNGTIDRLIATGAFHTGNDGKVTETETGTVLGLEGFAPTEGHEQIRYSFDGQPKKRA